MENHADNLAIWPGRERADVRGGEIGRWRGYHFFFLMDVDREDSQLGLRMTRGRRIKAGQRTQDRRSNQKGKYARGITVHKADASN
jgi:hypothetical protein